MPPQLRHSEGVTRVLDAARELALSEASVTVTARHVLQALWRDESRAHEILSDAGVSQAEFDLRFPSPPSVDDAAGDVLPDFSTQVTAALRTARGWLRGSLAEAELRTEHLLAALSVVDNDCARLLADAGLDAAAFGSPEPIATPEPLPFESADTLESGESQPSTVHHPSTSAPQPSTLNPQPATLRILDAAANRAREGLRVVEDYTRFILNDAHLSRLLKEIRHELAAALRPLGSDTWHALRDTPGDVGTSVSTPAESQRNSESDVVRASLKRLCEALRSLEEYGKLIDVPAASAIEGLRYRCYTVEKAILTTMTARTRLADARLYLLVTASLCRTGFENVIRGGLDGGVDVVQLREKNWNRELRALAEDARRWTRDADALLIINDRADIAAALDADGVHVGQEDLPVREARRLVGPHRLIGVSTHNIEQARQAVLDGADYLGVGPVFPSETKQFDQFAGLGYVRQVAAEISLPWFAIGGIKPENIGAVYEAGAPRVAVSSALCGADDPRVAASAFIVGRTV